jgi:hypothetical protein
MEIEPYNESLKEKSSIEIGVWASNILRSLKHESDIKNDLFMFLAEKQYRKFLIPRLKNYQVSLEGLKVSVQLNYIKNVIENPYDVI